jgi:hypothetical protein
MKNIKVKENKLSFVEVELLVLPLDRLLVCLLEVLWQHYVSVFAHGLHTCFLADGLDVCCRDFVGARHVVFQVDLLGQIHFVGASLEHETLLTSVWHREFDLTVQTARSKQRRVKSVRSVRRHNYFHICRLVEAIHLTKQLNQNSLDFTISTSVRIVSLSCNSIDFVNENDGGCILFRHAEDITDHAGTFTKVLLHELTADHSDDVST